MKKFIKIGITIVIVLGLAVVWFANPGDIQSKILRSKANAEVKAKKLMKSTKISPEKIERAKQCRDNLERIQRAKIAAQQRHPVGYQVTWKEVLQNMNMQQMPKCPDGGNYKLNPPLQVPTCSIGGNGTIPTEDDHAIYH